MTPIRISVALALYVTGCANEVIFDNSSGSGVSGSSTPSSSVSTSSNVSSSSGGAGGGGGTPSLHLNSGTRLKLRYFQTEDGTRVFDSIFDSKLGIGCFFATAEDGKLRCLPNRRTFVEFADDQCKQAMLITGALDANVPTFGNRYAPGYDVCSSDPAEEFYQVDPDAPPITQGKIYEGMGGDCEDSGGQIDPTHPRTAFKHMDPSEFVGETTDVFEGGDHLQIQVAEGEDGSRTILGLIDSSRQAVCSANALSSGDWARSCVPEFEEPYEFIDSDCKTPVLAPGDCTTPLLIALPHDGPAYCSSTPTTLYQIGDKISGSGETSYIQDFDGKCTAWNGTSDDYYGVGKPAVATDYPRLPVATVGEGPVKAAVTESQNGIALTWQTFVNGGVECFAQPTKDGSYRCIPELESFYPAAGSYFADASCTQPVIDLGECAEKTAKYAAAEDDSSVIGTVYPIGSLLTGKWYYLKKSNGDCGQMALAGKNIATVGAPMDPSQFPLLTQVIDK